MATYTWEDVYRKKDNEELYKTYKGTNNSTYEQKKLALRILEERNFDFSNIDDQIKHWKKVNKRKEKEQNEKYPKLHFVNKNFGFIISTLAGLIFLSVLTEFLQLDTANLEGETSVFVYMMTFGPLLTVVVGLIMQYLIHKKKKKSVHL